MSAGSTPLQVPVGQLYRRLEIVGKGAYGSVHRGVHIPTGQVVAIKIINLDTPDDDVEDIQREVALLSQLRGGELNNVTKYYGCWLDGPRVWIVMDFASGGSVRTLMKACPGGIIDEKFVVVIVREVLVALAYLHKSAIIHRDIKAANILVTSSGRCLVADFGVAALLATTHSKRSTFVGTPYWMAPEVITSHATYDTKADIWSLGITIYEMATGAPPHADQVGMKALVIIPKSKPPRLPEERGSKEMREFVANCLRELPPERLTAEELAKTKWIKSAAKTSVTTLKELINRFARWQDGGGVRENILGELDWEHDDPVIDRRSIGWEFDTVRPRTFSDASSLPPDLPTLAEVTEPLSEKTERPRHQAMAPRSLRYLFEDKEAVDPYRIPLPRSNLATPTPPQSSTITLPTFDDDGSSSGGGSLFARTGFTASSTQITLPTFDDDTWGKGSSSDSSTDYDLQTARQPFFPSRSPTPHRDTPSRGRGLENRNRFFTDDESGDDSMTVDSRPTLGQGRSLRNYKDIRATKGLANISIPPPTPTLVDRDGSSPDGSPRHLGAPQGNQRRPGASPASFQFPRPAPSPAPGKTFQFPPPLPVGTPPASSKVFQFPPPRPPLAGTPPTQSPASLGATTTALTQTHLSSRSFDGSEERRPSPQRQQTMPALHVQPQSAASLSASDAEGTRSRARPSLSPQTSISALETANATVKPFARSEKGSGSQSSFDMPTPTAVARPAIQPQRSGSSFSGRSDAEGPQSPSVGLVLPGKMVPREPTKPMGILSTLDVAPSHLSVLSPTEIGPPSPLNTSPARYFTPQASPLPGFVEPNGTSASTSPSHQAPVDARGGDASGLSTPLGGVPPALRPLDFAGLNSAPDGAQAELARTLAELGRWLGVVEAGLSALLPRGGENGIEDIVEEPELAGVA